MQGWVVNGFAPLIFEGWMMEIVKGRAFSRTTTGYDDVAVVVEAIVDLSGYAAAADAVLLKGYVKFTARPTLNPNSFVSPVSVARFADIIGDPAVRAADLNPPASSVAFNAMDRTVHRRPGYAFAVARNSDRISKYEYMSGENLLPWFQGDGAHYLYLSGEDQTKAFGVDYFTTVSPYALAGVTAPVEERRTIPELYGTQYYDNPPVFTASSEAQNTYVYFPRGTNQYSGGATLGPYGAAGWIQSDDIAYAERDTLPADFVVYRNARSTKSWFMFDEEIVVLAAGIGDETRAVTTSLDARIAAPTDQVAVTRDTKWLRYANLTAGTAVGYYFLTPGPVAADLVDVTRSRRVIRTSNPDTAVTKKVFTLTSASTALAYALVPQATESRLSSYAHGRLLLLSNTQRLQAIHHPALNLTAANSFTPGRHTISGLTVDGPASVLTQRQGRTTTVAVSDPTMARATITITLLGQWLRKLSGDATVDHTLLGTRLTYNTTHTYGRTLSVALGR
jgi:hyaluronate lyase